MNGLTEQQSNNLAEMRQTSADIKNFWDEFDHGDGKPMDMARAMAWLRLSIVIQNTVIPVIEKLSGTVRQIPN